MVVEDEVDLAVAIGRQRLGRQDAPVLARFAGRHAMQGRHVVRRVPALRLGLDDPAVHELRGPARLRERDRAQALDDYRTNVIAKEEIESLQKDLARIEEHKLDKILALLAELKREHALLLVEHDMDAVFRIADRITVMVNGAVIASGTPDFVRNSAEVRTAYLGGH